MLNFKRDSDETPVAGGSALSLATNQGAELHLFKTVLDHAPINVMVADAQSLEITYVNESGRQTLKALEEFLPVKADELIGAHCDIFHVNPSHQRRMLANPENLPHRTVIQVGEEHLDLMVSAADDQDGNYAAVIVTWSVVTDKIEAEKSKIEAEKSKIEAEKNKIEAEENRAKAEKESKTLENMVNDMPINVMMCDPESLEITFINKTSIETLRPLQSLLPVPVDELMGQCIDIFHKNPSMQRQLLSDPANLPHNAKIQLAEHILDLRVAAIRDNEGSYLGPMVTWSVVTEQVQLMDDFKVMIEGVSSAAEGMDTGARALSQTAAQGSEKATAVAAAAEETSANVQTVAAATEELSSSSTEIGRQVAQSSQIAQEAVAEAQRTNETVQGLSEASGKIGAVVDLINDIASQTNLLALNATIEAARAGEAGKGFAVVASEVKSLAGQTGSATEEIAGQIDSIQQATADAVQAIDGIGSTIDKINEIAGSIAAAVEEQGAATEEISRNVQEAATSTHEVTENITSVTVTTQETTDLSGQVLSAVEDLRKLASDASDQTKAFFEKMDNP